MASQLVRKFPASYGTQRFITTFTTARHLPITLPLVKIWPTAIQYYQVYNLLFADNEGKSN
jgi:hypothetical protein